MLEIKRRQGRMAGSVTYSKVSETRRDRQGIYEGYIKIAATLADGSVRRVAGTVFSDGRPRLIQIKDIGINAEFAPTMIYVVNEDQPGMIGRLGTVLGDAKVNIANFHLGRSAPGADAQDHPRLAPRRLRLHHLCRRRVGASAVCTVGGPHRRLSNRLRRVRSRLPAVRRYAATARPVIAMRA